MDKAELLSEFQARVDRFEKYQGFIDKAKSQAGKFAAAVVEKVIQDNQSKSLEVVGEIVPLMADMEGVVQGLAGERERVLSGAQDSQFKLEELELRYAIGDLSDELFEAEASEYKKVVESTDARVADIDKELQTFKDAIDRWQTLGVAAGVFSQEEAQPMPEPDIVEVPADSAIELEVDGYEGADDMTHMNPTSPERQRVEFDDAGPGDGFDVGDLDILGDDEEIDLDGGDAEPTRGAEDEKPRRAVLLYQEGTAEEQIYPFTGEILSLGRGRDNDVQVKNDSKVSRYHCKLYRRGPNFYIEDNKSANGTLVNGELITERRLFGGEEVIIGETFFRFRILD